MNEWILISIAIVAILVLIGIVLTLVFWKKKKEGKIEETYAFEQADGWLLYRTDYKKFLLQEM